MMVEPKHVKPRAPGLYPKLRTGPNSDAEQVEIARLHLIKLLCDPFYQEAAIRLKRSGKLAELINDPGGNPAIGNIARKLQQPKTLVQKRKSPGAPRKLTGLTELFLVIERSQVKGRSIIDWCRRVVRANWPNATEEQQEKVAKETQRKLLDIRRRMHESN